LIVTMPKKAEAQHKQIPVRGDGQQGGKDNKQRPQQQNQQRVQS